MGTSTPTSRRSETPTEESPVATLMLTPTVSSREWNTLPTVWDSVSLSPGCPLLQSMTELPPPSTPSPLSPPPSTPSLWLPPSSMESPPSPSRTPPRLLLPEPPTSLLWRPPRPVRGRDVRPTPPSSPAAPGSSPPPPPSSTTPQSSPPTTDSATPNLATTDLVTTDSATATVFTVPTVPMLVSTKQKYQNLPEL